MTVADYWRTLDKPARRKFLLDSGAKVYAIRLPAGEEPDRPTGYARLAATLEMDAPSRVIR